MDGTECKFQLICDTLLRCVLYCGVSVAWLPCRPAPAELPPPLKVESDAQPISRFHLPEDRIFGNDEIVRPKARILLVNPQRSNQPQPTIIRPRASLIVAPKRGVEPTAGRISGDAVVSQAIPGDESGVDVAPLEKSNNSKALSVEEALATRGSVTFRKTPISEVVFLLSDIWHINIVAGENVSGEVSGSFRNAPLSEVLSATLSATGYSYRKTGNSLVVLPIDQIGSEDPSFASRTIQLPPSLKSDDSAMQAAQLLLSERGRLQRVGKDTLLVVDNESRIESIRRLFGELAPQQQTPVTVNPESASVPGPESPITPTAITQSGIAYFSPQFTEAEQMAVPLQAALGESVVVAAYPEENRIMVKGTADELRLATEAVQQLDRPRAQVRITAMIYDVGLGELEEHGVNWTRDLRVLANANNEALEDVTQTINELWRFNADLAATGATSIGITTLTDTLAAGAFLEMLDSTTEAKLLADPSITVSDRSQASIRIVRRIPIVGANPVENSNAVFTQTEFEEAGVILSVMPRIGRDGTIEMKVSPEYSVVAEITTTGPVIDSRTADTIVRVGNGQMFVLGGLRQRTVVESIRGIPYLKDIKHLGKLFRSHDTEVRESELIVFLKPEIISPYDMGSPRQQVAGGVSVQQLNAIPYAEPRPQTPCCQDPNCPNHHPRCRINGGSDMLGDESIYPHIYEVPQLQIIDEATQLPPEPELVPQHGVIRPNRGTESARESDDLFPPVQVDSRVRPIVAGR